MGVFRQKSSIREESFPSHSFTNPKQFLVFFARENNSKPGRDSEAATSHQVVAPQKPNPPEFHWIFFGSVEGGPPNTQRGVNGLPGNPAKLCLGPGKLACCNQSAIRHRMFEKKVKNFWRGTRTPVLVPLQKFLTFFSRARIDIV